MTPDGRFTAPRRPAWPIRIGVVAVLVAIVASGIAVALLVLWFALILIPVAIVAALVAWAALRFQLWRTARSAGSQLRR